MIIDSKGNPVSLDPRASAILRARRPPVLVRMVWALSFVALLVGVAAAALFALWLALILIPLAIVASAVAGIVFRLRLARVLRLGPLSTRS